MSGTTLVRRRARTRSRTVGSEYSPRVPDSPVPTLSESLRSETPTSVYTDSSIYPPSSSTEDSPPSPVLAKDPLHLVAVEGEDEVAYHLTDSLDIDSRLKLLVKNQYFLPPAHAKPSLKDFAPPPKKSPSPAFLDLFRVGRSRSKPSSPLTSPPIDRPVPVLRSPPRKRAQSESRAQVRSRHPPQGRVAVVREQLPDLAAASIEAERELRARPHVARSTPYLDINPTDDVDVAPPSSNSPFAMQTSQFHGLAVQDSIGADVLAEKLPPSSPEEQWRRQLLHAAVARSIDNSSEASHSLKSPPRSPLSLSTSSIAFNSRAPLTPPLTPPTPSNPSDTKIILGQRITISSPISPAISRRASEESRSSTAKSMAQYLTIDGGVAQRAETPIAPPIPLAPPPRKQQHNSVNPLYSLSQIDLSNSETASAKPSSQSRGKRIKKTKSSTSLRREEVPLAMTPPPVPRSPVHRPSMDRTSSADSSHYQSSIMSSSESESHYSGESEGRPRVSMALSAMRDGRHSSARASPLLETSGEEDPAYESYRSAASSIKQRPSFDMRLPRFSASSPPPRASSTAPVEPLAPPPRRSSLHYTAVQQTTPTQSDFSSSIRETAGPPPLTPEIILEPEPTTPPLPSAGRKAEFPSLTLSISKNHIGPPSIRSAPPPMSSSMSFFDSIQSQPNAMDDLDSSDSEDDEPLPPPMIAPYARSSGSTPGSRNNSPSSSQTSLRPGFTRFGNYSTPHVSHSGISSDNGSVASLPVTSKRPIGHTIQPAPFFSKSRSDIGHGAGSVPATALDLLKFTKPQRSIGARSFTDLRETNEIHNTVLTAADVERKSLERGVQKVGKESSKELDGLLLKHMAAEKDALRMITSRSVEVAGTGSSKGAKTKRR